MAEKQPDISLIPSEQKKQGYARAASFRKPKQPLGGSFKVLLLVLILLIVGSVGLFFLNVSLAEEEETLQSELMTLRSERDAATEGEILELDGILRSFNTALLNHRIWSGLFESIENTTVEGIAFVSFEGDYETGTLSIRGVSPNYNLLAQQVKSLEENDDVIQVDVPNVVVNKEGVVDFNIVVFVKRSAI